VNKILKINRLVESKNSRKIISLLKRKLSLKEPTIEDLKVCQDYVNALAKIGDHKATNVLIETIKGPMIIAESAVVALGKLGDKKALEPLIKLLDSNLNELKIKAADSLGALGYPDPINDLIKLVFDNDDQVSDCAVNAITNLNGKENLIGALVQYLKLNKNGTQKIVHILDNLGWDPTNQSAELEYWIAKKKWEKCSKFGEMGKKVLINHFISGNYEVAYSLALIDDETVKNVLYEEFLKLEEPKTKGSDITECREAICNAIAMQKDSRVIENICKNLGYGTHPSYIKLLENLEWSPNSDELALNYYLAKGNWAKCIELGTPAVEPIINLIQKSYSVEQFEKYAKILAKIPDPQVKPFLKSYLTKTQDYAYAARSAIKIHNKILNKSKNR